MADLQRRLPEASAANPESPDERMRRELGVLYVQTADNPDRVAASKHKAARWLEQAFDDLAGVVVDALLGITPGYTHPEMTKAEERHQNICTNHLNKCLDL